jgi:hypothetical protein
MTDQAELICGTGMAARIVADPQKLVAECAAK